MDGIRPIVCLVFLSLLACAAGPVPSTEPANLALNKPASASSIENDEHSAARADDGDSQTCWRADDEPEGTPEWWQVDLGKPAHVTGCQICWPYDGKVYRYRIEGSADGKDWSGLSDKTTNSDKSQVQDVKFANAPDIRYVKITVTGFEEGCWASICEVKVFGLE
jgi:hypothetical protein